MKPEEIYDVIEHYCLGRRRLHLFGSDSTIRPGRGCGKWVWWVGGYQMGMWRELSWEEIKQGCVEGCLEIVWAILGGDWIGPGQRRLDTIITSLALH